MPVNVCVFGKGISCSFITKLNIVVYFGFVLFFWKEKPMLLRELYANALLSELILKSLRV